MGVIKNYHVYLIDLRLIKKIPIITIIILNVYILCITKNCLQLDTNHELAIIQYLVSRIFVVFTIEENICVLDLPLYLFIWPSSSHKCAQKIWLLLLADRREKKISFPIERKFYLRVRLCYRCVEYEYFCVVGDCHPDLFFIFT